MATWQNKIVVITGGSAGLGLEIAKAFAKKQALPVIIGRDENRCHSAVEWLASDGLKAEFVIGDVTQDDSIEKSIDEILERHGQIDVFVNNVGRSIRVDLMKASIDQYQELMELNLMAAIRCSHFVLPALAKTSGHLVNIGSLSSRVAWPFLGPYTTSKFALDGFTQQLRVEGPGNVHYMMVCPGPIKRDDSGTRYNKEFEDLPANAKKPGAGANIKGLDPGFVAGKIVTGCERRKREIVLPARVRILFAINSISPALGDWILRRMMK